MAAVWPSPKSQSQEVGVGVLWSVKLTVSGALQEAVLVAVKVGMGGLMTVMGSVLVVVQPAYLLVSVTEEVPVVVKVFDGEGAFDVVPSPKLQVKEGGVGVEPLEKVAGVLTHTVVGPLIMAELSDRFRGSVIWALQPNELLT